VDGDGDGDAVAASEPAGDDVEAVVASALAAEGGLQLAEDDAAAPTTTALRKPPLGKKASSASGARATSAAAVGSVDAVTELAEALGPVGAAHVVAYLLDATKGDLSAYSRHVLIGDFPVTVSSSFKPSFEAVISTAKADVVPQALDMYLHEITEAVASGTLASRLTMADASRDRDSISILGGSLIKTLLEKYNKDDTSVMQVESSAVKAVTAHVQALLDAFVLLSSRSPPSIFRAQVSIAYRALMRSHSPRRLAHSRVPLVLRVRADAHEVATAAAKAPSALRATPAGAILLNALSVVLPDLERSGYDMLSYSMAVAFPLHATGPVAPSARRPAEATSELSLPSPLRGPSA